MLALYRARGSRLARMLAFFFSSRLEPAAYARAMIGAVAPAHRTHASGVVVAFCPAECQSKHRISARRRLDCYAPKAAWLRRSDLGGEPGVGL